MPSFYMRKGLSSSNNTQSQLLPRQVSNFQCDARDGATTVKTSAYYFTISTGKYCQVFQQIKKKAENLCTAYQKEVCICFKVSRDYFTPNLTKINIYFFSYGFNCLFLSSQPHQALH